MDGSINFFVAILLDLSLHTSHDLKADCAFGLFCTCVLCCRLIVFDI